MVRMPMNYHNLAGGALAEQVDAKIKEILENIDDVNTPWKPPRKVIISLTFTPNEDRDRCAVKADVSTKIPGFKTIESGCFITRLGAEKTLVAIENEDPRQRPLFPPDAAESEAVNTKPEPRPNLTMAGAH